MPVPNRLLKSELKQAEKPRKILEPKEPQYFKVGFHTQYDLISFSVTVVRVKSIACQVFAEPFPFQVSCGGKSFGVHVLGDWERKTIHGRVFHKKQIG